MRSVLLVSAISAAALVAGAAHQSAVAAPYGSGDLFVSTVDANVLEYTPGGTLVQTLTSAVPHASTAGSAFDPNGTFYVTTTDGNAVARFGANGAAAGTYGSGYDVPVSIVFDRAGNAYVGQVNGPVLKFDSTGAPEGSFVVGGDANSNAVLSLDLAADQCTLEYTVEQFVRRFDVCTNTQLPNLNAAALPGTSAFGIRVLPDGGVLVADGSVVVRLNAAGAVVQTYLPAPDPTFLSTSVALDPAGTGFWALDIHGRLRHVDLATGDVLGQFDAFAPPGEGGEIGLSVRDGFEAAQAPPSRRRTHRHHVSPKAAPRHHGCSAGRNVPDASNDPNCHRLRDGA